MKDSISFPFFPSSSNFDALDDDISNRFESSRFRQKFHSRLLGGKDFQRFFFFFLFFFFLIQIVGKTLESHVFFFFFFFSTLG